MLAETCGDAHLQDCAGDQSGSSKNDVSQGLAVLHHSLCVSQLLHELEYW